MNAKYIKYDRESDRFNLIVDAVLSLFTGRGTSLCKIVPALGTQSIASLQCLRDIVLAN